MWMMDSVSPILFSIFSESLEGERVLGGRSTYSNLISSFLQAASRELIWIWNLLIFCTNRSSLHLSLKSGNLPTSEETMKLRCLRSCFSNLGGPSFKYSYAFHSSSLILLLSLECIILNYLCSSVACAVSDSSAIGHSCFNFALLLKISFL